jgi:negative regulator of flagellin synthesis FlgM
VKIDQNVIALKSPAAGDSTVRARNGAAAPATASPSATVATRLPLAPAADFDAARVAQIREAIAAGKYQVDTSRIADGLLDHVQELLGKS